MKGFDKKMARTQIYKITCRIAHGKVCIINGRDFKNACPQVKEIVAKVIDGGRDNFTVEDYLNALKEVG